MDGSDPPVGETGLSSVTDLAAAFSALDQAVNGEGGYDNIVAKLREAGFEVKVDSWVSTGVNQPLDPTDLAHAFGPGAVQRLSATSTIDVSALLPLLSAFLPRMIDLLTPDGRTPVGGLDLAARRGEMPDLGSLLGGSSEHQSGTAAVSGPVELGDLDSRLGRLAGPGGWDKDR